MKFTKHNLKKIQGLLEEVGYEVRFEKGNFQSGYCVLETRRVAIINRFFDTEGRINAMLDIISKVVIDPKELTPENAKVYKKLDFVKMRQEESKEEIPITDEKSKS
ncbi:MAG: hypothetical protein ACPG5P_05260 [Saprospiraceae bacterium]